MEIIRIVAGVMVVITITVVGFIIGILIKAYKDSWK